MSETGWPTAKAVTKGAQALAEREAGSLWRDFTPREQDDYREQARLVLDAVGLPEVVGISEVAAVLGIKNPSQLVSLPEPVYVLAAGRFYLASEIRALAQKRAKRGTRGDPEALASDDPMLEGAAS